MFQRKLTYLLDDKLADQVILRFCESFFDQIIEVVKELSVYQYSEHISHCSEAILKKINSNILVTVGSLARSGTSVGSDCIASCEVLQVLLRYPKDTIDDLFAFDKGQGSLFEASATKAIFKEDLQKREPAKKTSLQDQWASRYPA